MRSQVTVLTLLLTVPTLASASQIAVGLDWRQSVFVQEIWQDGKPRYALYNARAAAITLHVRDVQFVNRPGTEAFMAVEGNERGRWEIPARSVLLVDAPMPPANDGLRFLRFRIVDGPSLGVLSYPLLPRDLPRTKILSTDGLNGSGSRRSDTYYEQDTLTFKADGVIEVRLTLPARGESVTFKKKKSIDQLPEAILLEARSDTLSIQAGKDEVKIDTHKPLKPAAQHAVTLRFQAPRTETRILVAIDGWVSLPSETPGIAGGGFHVIRGMVVEAEKR